MLRIFTPVKIQRLRPGLSPQTWVLEVSMLTTRPPKSSHRWLMQEYGTIASGNASARKENLLSKICARLGFYAAYNGSFLPMFRRPDCPEMSVRN